MTERQIETLKELYYHGWVTPMIVGGTNGSHHSRTLSQLVKKGLVERTGGICWCRASYRYKISPKGCRMVRKLRRQV